MSAHQRAAAHPSATGPATALRDRLAGRHLACLLVVALISSGCAATKQQTQRWEADFYYTHRLHIDGQQGLAAKRYDRLRATAKTTTDADEAAMMSCDAQRAAKVFRAAAACFDQLAQQAAGRAARTRALLHAAQVRYDELGQRQSALVIFTELVRRAPDTPAGLRALDWLTRAGQGGPIDARAAAARLVALERENSDSQLADNLLLRAAMLLHQHGDDNDRRRAIVLLERMQLHHKHSSALLPGLMLRAAIHRYFKEPRPESRALLDVMKTQETSYVFGTYVEPMHVKAMERLVELCAGPLRDAAQAEALLERLSAVSHKPMRRYHYLALKAQLRESRGDYRGALRVWRALLKDVAQASADMRANDQRICREEDTPVKVQRCLQAVQKFGPLPVKEVPLAKAAIMRLRAHLEGGQ